ncbi:MAG: DUF1566 domain-containing protein, partial [Desulfobacterales bacterium]|nr:DUF1566 domain-containing protein [Desulfobacterales bacterium]
MKKHFTITFTLYVIFITLSFAGNIDSPAPPTDPASAMYKLEDVYNRFDTGAAGSKRTGAFTEPSVAPSSTGRTLDEIMNKAPYSDNTNGAIESDVRAGKTFWGLTTQKWGLQTGKAWNPAPVEKTGQTTSYASADDGAAQKGVTWANPRFTDNGNGTVTDNNTGLIWLKNISCFGAMTWGQGVSSCNNLFSGSCGLTDGSQAGDWRLPNIKELESLIDYGRTNPALPNGHPFIGVQSDKYWTSTTG